MNFFKTTAITLGASLLLGACGGANDEDGQAGEGATEAAIEVTPPFTADMIQTAKLLRERGLQSDLAYQITEDLTTEIGPRLAGGPRDAAAVEWAVARFEELGFDRVWTEPVEIPQWERVHAEARVTSPFPQPLVITSLGHAAGTGPDGVEAEIAHFETLGDLQAADPADVEGKIVFISNKMARTRDGSGYGPAVQARGAGSRAAAEKGAVGLLIRSIGTDSHRFPHTGGIRLGPDGERGVPAAALSNPDADQLVRILERSPSATVHMTLVNEIIEEPFTTYTVVGELTGREAPDEIILLGSHLDSWDLGTGAIDDGAGVGITAAAARLIADLPQRPRRSIRVVAFGAEEIGLFGARAYAAAHGENLDNHIIGAESDFGAGAIWAFAPTVHEAAVPAAQRIQQLLAPLDIEWGGNGLGFAGPDMGPMMALGMPGAALRQDGTDYFDLHHTADDTFDKIDPDAMAQNQAAYAVFAYLAAEWPGYFDHRAAGEDAEAEAAE